MNDFDALVEGFDGLGAPSSEGERRPDVAEGAGSTPAGPIIIPDVPMMILDAARAADEVPAHRPPTEEEAALGVTRVSDIAAMTRDAWAEHDALDEPPHEPDDWPEPEPEIPVFPINDDLRVLRPDHRPQPGRHYVVFGGKPTPVVRAFAQTEDEFVRSQMDPSDTLKDLDGQRRIRADRTLRMRYRGYVSGEMSTL